MCRSLLSHLEICLRGVEAVFRFPARKKQLARWSMQARGDLFDFTARILWHFIGELSAHKEIQRIKIQTVLRVLLIYYSLSIRKTNLHLVVTFFPSFVVLSQPTSLIRVDSSMNPYKRKNEYKFSRV